MTIFKPGETYKTRDGREARVYAVDGRGDFSVHGAILDKDGWSPAEWTKSGRHYGPEMVGPYDLMPPKRELWVNVFRDNGTHVWFRAWDNKQEADFQERDISSTRIARIRVEYTEGQFDD